MQRRLAAIVAADIVGFSRLVGVDEEGTLAGQRAHLAETIQPLIIQHGGRIANTAGDSLLLEFPSAVEAVRFAIAMQGAVASRNGPVEADRRIEYRIGINVGDVVPDGEDLLGDGVNVAARLEGLAPAGGIILSRAVRDQVRDRINVPLEDLGEVEVKNIARPVRAFRVLQPGEETAPPPRRDRGSRIYSTRLSMAAGLVVLLGAAGWWWMARPDFEPVRPQDMARALPDGPSIAILPFDFIGADKAENEYLAIGISGNISANLAKLPELLVIVGKANPGSGDSSADLRAISARLGVRYVLRGSVQKSGDNLRITSQLIDAVAGKHLWSDTFDRKTSDFFAIQDEITLAVMNSVYGKAISGDPIDSHETTNLAAFTEMAKGEAHRLMFTPGDNRLARGFFKKAIDLDPDYVDPLVGTGFTHLMDVRLGFAADRASSLTLAEEFFTRALEMNPQRAHTLQQFALLRVVQKRGDEARELALHAVQLSPGDLRVISGAAWVLKYIGDSKASLDYFAKAKRMQPVHEWWLVADEFGALIDAEEFDAAVLAADAYLDVAPEVYRPHFLAYAAVPSWKTDDRDRAKALIAELLGLRPDFSIADLRLFDLAYVDPEIPERRYRSLAEMGIPDGR